MSLQLKDAGKNENRAGSYICHFTYIIYNKVRKWVRYGMADTYTKQQLKGKDELDCVVIFSIMDRGSEAAAADLRRLALECGAEIAFSSSLWDAYFRDVRNSFQNTGKELKELFENLAHYHLKIPGITPQYFNGAYGRPFEIRAWLCRRPCIESFVILDDDTFWQWNWLGSNFVCTRHEAPPEAGRYSSQYIKGLDHGFTEQAV